MCFRLHSSRGRECVFQVFGRGLTANARRTVLAAQTPQRCGRRRLGADDSSFLSTFSREVFFPDVALPRPAGRSWGSCCPWGSRPGGLCRCLPATGTSPRQVLTSLRWRTQPIVLLNFLSRCQLLGERYSVSLWVCWGETYWDSLTSLPVLSAKHSDLCFSSGTFCFQQRWA